MYTFTHQIDSLYILTLRFRGEGQVGHASQRVWMLLAQHPLRGLHHAHLQLLGFLPASLISVCRDQIVHATQRIRILLA